MSNSLRVKLVIIMLLIMVLLMTVVLVLLISGVQDFYTRQFSLQMETAFTHIELISALRDAAGDNDAVSTIREILIVYSGELGIDRNTRNFYILDGITGALLETSNPDRNVRIEISPNIQMAILGERAFMGSSRADYMDIAVPIISRDEQSRFIISIIDTKQTVQRLNTEIFSIILRAVMIGFAISVVISLIISKTLLLPIRTWSPFPLISTTLFYVLTLRQPAQSMLPCTQK